eukprot:498599-Alexandrium_andersonii.AAC.1
MTRPWRALPVAAGPAVVPPAAAALRAVAVRAAAALRTLAFAGASPRAARPRPTLRGRRAPRVRAGRGRTCATPGVA